VFFVGTDPVESGLVESLNRPGGNVTGISILDVEVVAKRIQLLHQLIPTATSIALLVNPKNPITSRAETREAQLAARALGLHLLILEASDSGDIPVAITTFVQQQASALLVSNEVFFFTVQDQLIDLAIRHRIALSIPEISAVRKGALLSYAPDAMAAWREVGVYAGRILKGEKPGDLPVQRSVKINLVINLKTAKALGIDVPDRLLIAADEVIE
jgi:putative tryptophan/tyrosine transport system substrate-binding protein